MLLDLLSNVAVLCNAFVIAFTSDFIPKLYYYLVKHTMYGYIDDSLSYFDSSDIDVRNSNFHNVSVCRYRDLRLPPCHLGIFYCSGRFKRLLFRSTGFWRPMRWWLQSPTCKSNVIYSLHHIFICRSGGPYSLSGLFLFSFSR